jgi:SAM-dependent methyltransferase
MRQMPPALLSVAVHAVAGLIAFALTFMIRQLGDGMHGLQVFVLAEGLLAGLLSRTLGLPNWWQLINLGFFPLVMLALSAELSPHWYLAGFMMLALTSAGAVFTRVPLYLSSRQAWQTVASRLPKGNEVSVVDLGCGLGGLLAHLAHARPGAILRGVDAAPLPWLISRLRLHNRASVRFGSLWDEDLTGSDVVYAYLSPAPMARLWQKARQEMKPGSLFISNTFAIPGIEPDEVVELNDLSRARLLLWRM